MKEGIVFEIKKEMAIIMTSEGEFLSVPAKNDWQVGNTVRVNDIETRTNKSLTSNSIGKYKKLAIALVASLLILILPLTNITEASTIISLDINPSLELEVKNNQVTGLKALNADGKELLAEFGKIEGDVYQVTSQILDKAYEMGFLKADEHNYIMIGVLDQNDFEAIEYEQYIQSNMKEKHLDVEVVTLNASKEQKELADDKGISLGRFILQSQEDNNGINISDEQIKNKNVKEIMNMINDEKTKNQKEAKEIKEQYKIEVREQSKDNNNNNGIDKDRDNNDGRDNNNNNSNTNNSNNNNSNNDNNNSNNNSKNNDNKDANENENENNGGNVPENNGNKSNSENDANHSANRDSDSSNNEEIKNNNNEQAKNTDKNENGNNSNSQNKK